MIKKTVVTTAGGGGDLSTVSWIVIWLLIDELLYILAIYRLCDGFIYLIIKVMENKGNSFNSKKFNAMLLLALLLKLIYHYEWLL